MKRVFTSALIITLLASAAQAQTTTNQHQGHNQNKEHRMAFAKLNLSADQKARLKSVRQDFRKQFTELKKQDQITVAEMRTKRKELRQQFQSQVKAILTPAQQDLLAKMKAERRKNGRLHNNAMAFHKAQKHQRMNKLKQELNLTQQQQEKLAQIRSGYKDKFQSIRNDNALQQDQKKTQIKELRKQQQDEMKTVLTKEQQEKLQNLRKEHLSKNTK